MSEPDGFPKGVSAPARRALASAGYTDLAQLDGLSEAALQRLHGMGPKAVNLLREALRERGMALAD